MLYYKVLVDIIHEIYAVPTRMDTSMEVHNGAGISQLFP